MERIPNHTEAGAYDRVEVVEQAMSQARELLAEKLDLETSTSLERSAAISELIAELSATEPGTNIPLDNSNRHVVESLSIMLGLEEMMQPIDEYMAKHPELETV